MPKTTGHPKYNPEAVLSAIQLLTQTGDELTERKLNAQIKSLFMVFYSMISTIAEKADLNISEVFQEALKISNPQVEIKNRIRFNFN